MNKLKKRIDDIDKHLSRVIGDVDNVAPGRTRVRLGHVRTRIESAEDEVVSATIENIFYEGWALRSGRLLATGHFVMVVVFQAASVVGNLVLLPLRIFHRLCSRNSRKIENELSDRMKEIQDLRKAIKETEKSL
jgi:hypothetical protein